MWGREMADETLRMVKRLMQIYGDMEACDKLLHQLNNESIEILRTLERRRKAAQEKLNQ